MQEHWLFTFEKGKLEEFALSHNYSCLIKCVDENDPISARQRIRGWGGSALLWKKEFDQYIVPIEDGNERICGILVNVDSPLCILGVYMPTTGSKANDSLYEACTDQIREIMIKYDNYTCILMGDLNASFIRGNLTSRDKTFITTMKELQLVLQLNTLLE